MTNYEYLIGMTVEVAKNAVKSDGKYIRVVKKDGHYQEITAEYSSSRINVEVKNNIIVAITSIG